MYMKYTLQHTIQHTLKIVSLCAITLFCTALAPNNTEANNGDIIILEESTFGQIELLSDSLGNSKLYFGENLNNFLEWNADKNAFIFSNNVDFGGNQVLNFRMENLASAPICDANNSGRMYHNTTDTYSYICDTSVWKILDNDEQSAGALLPYLYNVSPNFLQYNKTVDLHITGSGLDTITTFELSTGITLNSFTIVNSEEAILNVTSGNTDAMVNIIGLNKGEKWEANALTVKVGSSLSLQDVLANLENNAGEVTDWIPEVYPLTLDAGTTANYIYDGGDNTYDKGNYLGTDTKNAFQYTNKQFIVDEDAFGLNGRYFTMLTNNIFILSASVGDGFTNFFTSGNLGADGNGNVDTFELEYNGYTVYIKRVYGAGSTPSLNHIFILDSSAVSETTEHKYSSNTNSDYDEITNIEKLATIENNKFYYFAFALKDGKYISNDDMRNLVEFLIDKMLSSIS